MKTKQENPENVSIKRLVFWPPFLLMLLTAGLNLAFPVWFGEKFRYANDWLIGHCGGLFVFCAFASLGLCVWTCVSPFGRLRLGGVNAKPLLKFWDWFAITLCTTIAVGILFWSTAEPVSHFVKPPQSLGLESRSEAASRFALSALYLHWTFVPYAMYCAASLVFAFAHHNMLLPYSLGSTLVPLLGRRIASRVGGLVDSLCLFSLVAGMAASLGTGVLTISGGLNELWGIPSTAMVWGIVTLVIVVTFIVSSATGLMRGIRVLSDMNAKGLLGLGLVVFMLGPTWLILKLGTLAVYDFAVGFLKTGLDLSLVQAEPWACEWSIFYWAVWLAWTPVTACFLGRIAYGRTVREFMLVNFLLPSVFCVVWMAVFGVTALELEKSGAKLSDLIVAGRYEQVSYAVLRSLPLGMLMIVFYLLSAFICFVTSADSNTSAMAAISSRGVSLRNPEGKLSTKVAWGMLVGLTAWAMITFANVDGIRFLSNLGGFPAAILMLLILGSLIVIQVRTRQLNLIDAPATNRRKGEDESCREC
ncbi:MAG: BCCT family transporter [Planctomycetota bacterium]